LTDADLQTPKPGRAYWSAFQPPEGDTRPIDPLAFDMYAARLGNLLLPGITGRTIRARYLGMVCAGLLVTGKDAHASQGRISSVRRQAFLPFERGWAFAVCENAGGDGLKEERDGGSRGLKPEYWGFRGANNVLRYWRETQGVNRLDPRAYTLLKGQSAQGGLGAYLVTLDASGFVDKRTLGLRESGRQLAEAFIGDQRKRMKYFVSANSVHRGMLSYLGSELDLVAPSAAEAAIIRHETFSPESGSLAKAVRGLGTATADPERALQKLARSDKELSSVAAYALTFEPVRQASLTAFGSLGNELASAGSLPANALPDDTVSAAERARKTAKPLAELAPCRGLEPIQALAIRIAAAKDAPAVIDILLDWHEDYRAAWISRDGPRLILGRRANFDFPIGFHGYTVPSYFDLLDDLRRADRDKASA